MSVRDRIITFAKPALILNRTRFESDIYRRYPSFVAYISSLDFFFIYNR